jgi:hypothetical protein
VVDPPSRPALPSSTRVASDAQALLHAEAEVQPPAAIDEAEAPAGVESGIARRIRPPMLRDFARIGMLACGAAKLGIAIAADDDIGIGSLGIGGGIPC